MTAHSGKEVDICISPLNAGSVSPRFRMARPGQAGHTYGIVPTSSEEFSLLADVLTISAIVSGLVSDVSINLDSRADINIDLFAALTGKFLVDVDLALAVSEAFGISCDLTSSIVQPTMTYVDIQIIIVDTSCDDDYTVEGYGTTGTRDPALEFLGKGLKFPFTFQRRSGGTQISTATSSDHAHIHESIRQTLGTRKGERFMRPEFGSDLHKLIFEPNDRILYGLIRHEVVDALDKWEPRIIVTDIAVEQGDDEHLVLVNISYRLISSQVEGNMVYPFYRESE
ncbi:MAG: GPW/gp25 family protein [Armatimonadota bacterium]